jgi:hypothetical protein
MKEQAHASWCGPRVAITRVACGRCLLEKWLRHRVIDAIRYITGTPRQRSFFQHLKDLDLGRRDDMGSENVVAGGPPGVGVHFLARSALLHHLGGLPRAARHGVGDGVIRHQDLVRSGLGPTMSCCTRCSARSRPSTALALRDQSGIYGLDSCGFHVPSDVTLT